MLCIMHVHVVPHNADNYISNRYSPRQSSGFIFHPHLHTMPTVSMVLLLFVYSTENKLWLIISDSDILWEKQNTHTHTHTKKKTFFDLDFKKGTCTCIDSYQMYDKWSCTSTVYMLSQHGHWKSIYNMEGKKEIILIILNMVPYFHLRQYL